MESSTPPSPVSPRFTLELEFVLCLSNPYYLQYLAQTYPHLLNPPTTKDKTKTSDDDSEAARFARYLAYLYSYWKTPEYSKYLTHPRAVLRNLEFLQYEQFRKDIIRPDTITKLLEVNANLHKDGNEPYKEEVEGTVVATRQNSGIETMDARAD